MSSPQYGLITIGNALVDVLAKTDDAYLEQQKAAAGMEKGSMNLIDAEISELSETAEREAFGFNKIQIHPDIYMNEIILGMRKINQVLPQIMEKLDIKFDHNTDYKE